MLPKVGQYLFPPVNLGATKQTQPFAAINSIPRNKPVQASQNKSIEEKNENGVKTVEESVRPQPTGI